MSVLEKHLTISLLLLLFGAGFLLGSRINGRGFKEGSQSDTCTITRTVIDSAAFLEAKKIQGYELFRVCAIDSLKELANKPARVEYEEVLVETPVIVRRDSIVYIQVPMEERVFSGSKDSVDYRITTLGYNTSVTTVQFSYPRTIITNTNTIVKDAPRIGFGVAAGPSVLVSPSGKIHGGAGITGGVLIRF